jgi:uncharacterized protein (TIGR02284 family)
MVDEKDIIKDVVEILHDGRKGFAELAEHIKDPEVKDFFLRESQTRAEFATELESAVSIKTDDEAGTAAGAFDRFWGEFKGKMGGGDHTLLETAEQGEDAAKEAYKKALSEDVILGSVRQILTKQQNHLQQAHDQVKAFRDRKAA